MVAYLTMRKFGIAEMAAKCAVSGLIQMEHRVRTVYGDLASYYGRHKWQDEGKFPHGNGQGNGDSPSLWAAINSPLLQILREMGHGVEFDSPITKKKMKLSAFGFVDDMDFVQTAREDEDEEQVWEKAQQGMTLWESLLRTTGGALELSDTKTDFVRIGFKWKNGRSKLMKKDDNKVLQVKDKNCTNSTQETCFCSLENSRLRIC